MNLWAIIPVKPFGLGKSRLAAVLGHGERAAINRRMFDHVFRIATAVLGRAHVAVVSADPDVLARAASAHPVHEHAPGDLNRALALAASRAVANGADALMVLPADLPDLTDDDVAALRDALGTAPSCAIAPDADEFGTNALAMTPPDTRLFRFGERSFAAHARVALARGYRMQIVRRPGLALDLDTPETYRAWLTREGAPA